jgi:predicted  nucleic acid-binding Zn ribbon protein
MNLQIQPQDSSKYQSLFTTHLHSCNNIENGKFSEKILNHFIE